MWTLSPVLAPEYQRRGEQHEQKHERGTDRAHRNNRESPLPAPAADVASFILRSDAPEVLDEQCERVLVGARCECFQ